MPPALAPNPGQPEANTATSPTAPAAAAGDGGRARGTAGRGPLATQAAAVSALTQYTPSASLPMP